MSITDIPRELTPQQRDIIRALRPALGHGRNRPSEVFSTWITLCEHSLRLLPHHAVSASQGLEMVDDDPAKQDWDRARSRFQGDPQAFRAFAEGLAKLMIASEGNWDDHLGPIFMSWGSPNAGLGQFFTPSSLCHLTASMTIPDGPGMLLERIRPVLEADPILEAFAQAALMVDAALGAEGAPSGLRQILSLCWERIKPIKINEPACGSGGMLLAAAGRFPAWAHEFGLVELSGMDIDPLCVSMTRVNLMLRGIYGHQRRAVVSDPAPMPPPLEPSRQLSLFGDG